MASHAGNASSPAEIDTESVGARQETLRHQQPTENRRLEGERRAEEQNALGTNKIALSTYINKEQSGSEY